MYETKMEITVSGGGGGGGRMFKLKTLRRGVTDISKPQRRYESKRSKNMKTKQTYKQST